MIYRTWLWFLASFRLSDAAVCEMSRGRCMWDDYHDYPDSEGGYPDYLVRLKCKRCGKEFMI